MAELLTIIGDGNGGYEATGALRAYGAKLLAIVGRGARTAAAVADWEAKARAAGLAVEGTTVGGRYSDRATMTPLHPFRSWTPHDDACPDCGCGCEHGRCENLSYPRCPC